MKIFDQNFKVEKRGYSRIEERREGWTDGEVITPWGVVSVYAQGDDTHAHHTRLDFVFAGRQWIRDFSGKRYSTRGLKTKAMQFAKEIHEANQ